MKKIIKCIINLAIIMTMMMGLMVNVYAVTLQLQVNPTAQVYQNQSYNPKGEIIQAYDSDSTTDKTASKGKVDISPSSIDTSSPGNYTINYKLELGGKTVTAQCELTVLPRIQLTIKNLSEGDTTISGKGTAGDRIDVVNQNGDVLASAEKVGNNGNWSITVTSDVLKAEDTITVKVVSPTGVNETLGTASTKVSAAVQRVQLTMEKVTIVDTTLAGKGTAGDTIQISINGNVIDATAKIKNNGNWTFDLPSGTVLSVGDTVIATVITPTGVDKTLGVATRTVANNVSGAALTIEAASDGDTKIAGTGNSGDKLEIHINGILINVDTTVKVGNNGNWSYTLPTGTVLATGQNIEVKVALATDPNSIAQTTVVDKLAINKIMEGDKTVSGTGKPGSTVIVTFPDGTIVNDTVGTNGKWSVTYSGTLKVGDIVNARDSSNSNIAATRTVTTMVAIDNIFAGDTLIAGTGTPGDAIEVTFPNGEKANTTVASDGTWSVTVLGTLNIGDQINVKATDPASGKSNSISKKAVDPSTKTPLSIDDIAEADKNIKGEGNKGDIIEIYLNGKLIGETTVNNKGVWKFTVLDTVYLRGNDVVKAVVKLTGEEVQKTVLGATTPIHVIKNPNVKDNAEDQYVYEGGNSTNKTNKNNKTTADENTTSAKAAKTKLNAVIYLSDYKLKVGDAFNFMKGVTAKDNGGTGKDVSKKITVKGVVNTKKTGTYILTYSVKGANGVTVSRKANITVIDDSAL